MTQYKKPPRDEKPGELKKTIWGVRDVSKNFPLIYLITCVILYLITWFILIISLVLNDI